MNLSSASHYRGGRCSVGLPTLGLDWEANDFFTCCPASVIAPGESPMTPIR